MATAGYSSTPLAKKLGVKEGFIINLINAPANYFDLFTDMPSSVSISDKAGEKKNLIHFFTKDTAELTQTLPQLKKEILPNGMIWVSWPKKSANIPTDVNEHLVRSTALENGLVDIKVCAVDDTWSGLKLVIPVKDRKG